MISRTHEAGAVAALLAIVVYHTPQGLTAQTVIIALIANTIGALLPDIDQASNRLWDLLPGGNFTGKVLRNVFLGHRTLSHSILGILLVYEGSVWLISQLFNNNFVNVEVIIFALLIGYGSHLFLDGLTEEGLPLLWPIKWKFGFPPWKFLRIKTGHWVENWVVFPLLVVYVLYLVYLLANRIN
ncbi:MAG: metal-dependent hydrolase [Candidatus Shapirobacteria bacterium]|nr:metal-dependent hydrolase [Candidatus Shapirobacteria bacterium]